MPAMASPKSMKGMWSRKPIRRNGSAIRNHRIPNTEKTTARTKRPARASAPSRSHVIDILRARVHALGPTGRTPESRSSGVLRGRAPRVSGVVSEVRMDFEA
jgi:hypothetical protein